MSRPACMLMAILLLMAIPAGHSRGAPPAVPPSKVDAAASERLSTNLWDEAQAALKRLDYQKAGDGFQKLLSLSVNDPRRTLCQYYAGYCALKRGKDQQAFTMWNDLLRQEKLSKTPTQATLLALEQMALYYEAKKRDQDLARTLSALLRSFPSNAATVRLHAAEAQKRIASGRFADASALYGKVESCLSEDDRRNLDMARALSEPSRQNAAGILEYANQCLESDRVDQAIQVYEAFLKQPGISADAWEAKTRLGWCLYLRGEYDKAENLWKSVVQTAPKSDRWTGESRWLLIKFYTGPLNRDQDAMELSLIQAREFAGEFRGEQALFHKAWLHWYRKEWALGKQAFADLIKAYPEDGRHPAVLDYIRLCEEGLLAGKGEK